MTRSYMVGYAGKTLDEAGLLAYQPFLRMSPEFARRFKGLMDFCIDAGRPLGLGGSWRSSDAQLQGFLSRSHPEDDANSSGDTFFKYILPSGRYGKPAGTLVEYWELNPGASPMAPPGDSYHESTEPGGFCLAVDAIGDTIFASQHAAKFGLIEFNKINGELWHYQPAEIPHARKRYVQAQHYPLKSWDTVPTPAPIPPAPKPQPVAPKASLFLKLPTNMNGPEVYKLQLQMQFWGWYPATAKLDGWFGQVSEAAVRTMQKALGLLVDGVYGPKSEAGLLKFLIAMQALAK